VVSDWYLIQCVAVAGEQNEEASPDVADSEPPPPFQVATPGVVDIQAYKDSHLAFQSRSSDKNQDPTGFQKSWNSFLVDNWLNNMFPELFLWLKETYPVDDPETKFYWVLLAPGKRGYLTEFVKRNGRINGKDLLECRVGAGRAWKDSKLYFGASCATLTACSKTHKGLTTSPSLFYSSKGLAQ
jgi:hypothetical protein